MNKLEVLSQKYWGSESGGENERIADLLSSNDIWRVVTKYSNGHFLSCSPPIMDCSSQGTSPSIDINIFMVPDKEILILPSLVLDVGEHFMSLADISSLFFWMNIINISLFFLETTLRLLLGVYINVIHTVNILSSLNLHGRGSSITFFIKIPEWRANIKES